MLMKEWDQLTNLESPQDSLHFETLAQDLFPAPMAVVQALVLSHMDCSNSRPTNLPASTLPLQRHLPQSPEPSS